MERVPTRRQNPELSVQPSEPAGVFWGLGKRILEHYEIFEVNEGGFGYVLGLCDLRSGERIAAKIPKGNYSGHSGVDDFTREVAIWIDLPTHENIVTARFVHEVHGVPALFMDYVEGTAFRTLRELIRMGHPSEETTLDFGFQICLGMEAANSNREVVHMDLKPENIMVQKGKTIKITDFGLAHRVRVVNGAYERKYAGSWPYAAPERFADEPCDSRSDIYSLGVILYEMLTGRFPYPFEMAEDPAGAFQQLRDFHAKDGMFSVSNDIYHGGMPGSKGQIGDIVSTFLHPSRGERARGFRQARSLLQELGARPKLGGTVGLTIAQRLARVEGLQAVGEHSAVLAILNRLLTEKPDSGALYLAAAKSLEATGNERSANDFRERAAALLRQRP